MPVFAVFPHFVTVRPLSTRSAKSRSHQFAGRLFLCRIAPIRPDDPVFQWPSPTPWFSGTATQVFSRSPHFLIRHSAFPHEHCFRDPLIQSIPSDSIDILAHKPSSMMARKQKEIKRIHKHKSIIRGDAEFWDL
jgi:hypothetical protein